MSECSAVKQQDRFRTVHRQLVGPDQDYCRTVILHSPDGLRWILAEEWTLPLPGREWTASPAQQRENHETVKTA